MFKYYPVVKQHARHFNLMTAAPIISKSKAARRSYKPITRDKTHYNTQNYNFSCGFVRIWHWHLTSKEEQGLRVPQYCAE